MELTQEQKLEFVLSQAHESLVNQYRIFMADDNYLPSPKFHYEISDILLNGKGNFAIEAYRGCGKTSIVLQSFPTYCLQFPDINRSYIVFIKVNQDEACKKIKELRDNYITNPNLKFNLIKVNEQSSQIFDVVVQGLNKEPVNVRFEAFGKQSPIRGLLHGTKRPHLVILDDIQDIDDAKSVTAIERDYNWFLSDVKPLGKHTRIFMIGNNLGEECLIEKIFRNAEHLNFKTLKIPILTKEGLPVWKEQYTLEEIEADRDSYAKSGKLDVWLREKMCESVTPETFVFKRDYFQYYRKTDTLLASLKVVIAVDPAISQKQSADNTAIVVIGMDNSHRIYVLETVFGKMLPDAIIDKIFQLAEQYKPDNIGIEKVAYQKMLIEEFKKQMRLRNKFFRLTELVPKGKKEDRIIAALQTRYASGQIFHLDTQKQLEAELLSMRSDGVVSSQKDDVIDGLSHAVSMLSITNKQTKSINYINKRTGSMLDSEEAFPETSRNCLKYI